MAEVGNIDHYGMKPAASLLRPKKSPSINMGQKLGYISGKHFRGKELFRIESD